MTHDDSHTSPTSDPTPHHVTLNIGEQIRIVLLHLLLHLDGPQFTYRLLRKFSSGKGQMLFQVCKVTASWLQLVTLQYRLIL